MVRRMAVLAVLVVSSAGMLWADDAVQTDWAGGDGIAGPVLDWGDRFDSASGVSWLAVAGQLALSSSALATPVEHLIDSSYAGNIGIGLGDIDGDGDIDVVGTAETSGIVSWWENDGGKPPAFTEHEIGTPPGAAGVDVADVDGDGRLDVVLMLVNPRNKIVWKRNEGGDPITWGTQTIQSPWRDAWEISTGDVDGDENLDVMCTYWTTGEVAWWQNAGDDPITWTKHTVANGFGGAHSVRGADLDDDGDMDLAAAGGIANKIVVYWSDGADSITWTQQDLETGFTGARSVWIDDIDRDGDLDIAGICWESDIAWWRNDGGDPVVWTRQTISTTADGGHALCIADVNGDGHPDVIGACYNNHKIAWWENDGGVPIVWAEHVLNGSYDGAITVRAGDLDQDGDLDPVGAGYTVGEFSWWEATEFDSTGELTSSILDAGSGLGRIDWNSTDPAGTSLMFQVRSSNDPGDLGAWSGNITVPGSLPGVLERYIQYKVLLGTTDSDSSPILMDVTFGSDSSGVEAVVGDHRMPDLNAQPNPFSPHVSVSFGLKIAEPVRLAVFDVTGRRVRELANARLGAGDHRFTWDGKDDRGDRQAPGVYWLLLETPDHKLTREVVLLR